MYDLQLLSVYDQCLIGSPVFKRCTASHTKWLCTQHVQASDLSPLQAEKTFCFCAPEDVPQWDLDVNLNLQILLLFKYINHKRYARLHQPVISVTTDYARLFKHWRTCGIGCILNASAVSKLTQPPKGTTQFHPNFFWRKVQLIFSTVCMLLSLVD